MARRRPPTWWRAAGVVGAAAGAGPDTAPGVGANVLLRAGDGDARRLPGRGGPRHGGEEYAFRFELPRPLVEAVVAERAVDWSNALFLSCRFRAWRAGEFNE